MSSKTMDDLRAALFDTLDQLKAGTLDLDRARAINDVGQTLINSAKVEVEYLRVSGGGDSTFIGDARDDDESLPPGITGRTVHRLK
jgi:hypothetical protein